MRSPCLNFLTFPALLNEVIYDEAENGHEDAQDGDEKPVDDVRENVRGDVIICNCIARAP